MPGVAFGPVWWLREGGCNARSGTLTGTGQLQCRGGSNAGAGSLAWRGQPGYFGVVSLPAVWNWHALLLSHYKQSRVWRKGRLRAGIKGEGSYCFVTIVYNDYLVHPVSFCRKMSRECRPSLSLDIPPEVRAAAREEWRCWGCARPLEAPRPRSSLRT